MSLRTRAPAGVLAAGLVGLLGAVGVAVPVPSSTAAASSVAAPAYCKDNKGVTVVVDMSALGGDIIVRCAQAPLGSRFTGLDALKRAGFSIAGTTRFGSAYVCRIQGRPSATESLPITGNPGYQEKCVNTPPQTAYWGYWYAKNGGSWTYSSAGAAGRTVIPGGFEGWAFSLNRPSSPPRPAFTPTRPKAPTAPAPSTPNPTTTPPTKPTSGGDNGAGGSTGGSSSDPSSPQDSQSPAAPGDQKPEKGDGTKAGAGNGDQGKGDEAPETTAPTDDSVTSAAGEVQVTGELPADPTDSESGGSAVPTLIGLGLLVVLGGGAGITAWRRSHHG